MKGLKEEEEGEEEEEEEVEEEEEEEPCRHILFFLRRRLREPGVCAVGRLGEMISWGSLWGETFLGVARRRTGECSFPSRRSKNEVRNRCEFCI